MTFTGAGDGIRGAVIIDVPPLLLGIHQATKVLQKTPHAQLAHLRCGAQVKVHTGYPYSLKIVQSLRDVCAAGKSLPPWVTQKGMGLNFKQRHMCRLGWSVNLIGAVWAFGVTHKLHIDYMLYILATAIKSYIPWQPPPSKL